MLTCACDARMGSSVPRLEETLALYEDILDRYNIYADELKQSGDTRSLTILAQFQPYIGSVLHNIGVVLMLRGDFKQAFLFFDRAAASRESVLGRGHVDHLVSLVCLTRWNVGIEFCIVVCVCVCVWMVRQTSRLTHCLGLARRRFRGGMADLVGGHLHTVAPSLAVVHRGRDSRLLDRPFRAL